MIETLRISGCMVPVLSYVESMLDMLPNLKHVHVNESIVIRISDADSDKLTQIIREKAPQMETFTVHLYKFRIHSNTNINLTSLCSAVMCKQCHPMMLLNNDI
jgi:hypothetical protein